jgi:hypothetical protein
VTDLFALCAGLDPHAVAEAIPPSVRRGVETSPAPRRDGDDVVIDGPAWIPRASPHHLLPSLALLTSTPTSVRFELSGRRAGAWSPWLATATMGDEIFGSLPATVDGLSADIDEIHAAPGLDAVRLRVRVGGPGAGALYEAPWLMTLSASDGTLVPAVEAGAGARRLAVPARSQMTEPEAVRMRICSPTSVGMALEFLGPAVATSTLAATVFHPPTDRYGVWPAAVRAAASHGVPGYLLRFTGWDAVAWCLARGLPIVASVRYAAGALPEAPMEATTGHLVVITGLEAGVVLVNDPAAPTASEVPRRYDRAAFARAWFEGSGVGYVFFRS